MQFFATAMFVLALAPLFSHKSIENAMEIRRGEKEIEDMMRCT